MAVNEISPRAKSEDKVLFTSPYINPWQPVLSITYDIQPAVIWASLRNAAVVVD